MTVSVLRIRHHGTDRDNNRRLRVKRKMAFARAVATIDRNEDGKFLGFDWQTLRGVMTGHFNRIYHEQQRAALRARIRAGLASPCEAGDFDDELPF